MKPLAISAGDPSGIGYELIIKAWLQKSKQALPNFIAIGDINSFKKYATSYGLELKFHQLNLKELEHSQIDNSSLPIIQVANSVTFSPGIAKTENAPAIIEAIEKAVDLVNKKICGAVVTCPIAKNNLYKAGFTYAGHTEFLAYLAQKFDANGKTFLPVMMLKGDKLTTVPVTIHTSLATVPKLLTKESILNLSRIVHYDMKKRFNIKNPRLAFAGLNPHAGEEGSMGQEEQTIITPAIKELQKENILASGPFPADSLFNETARKNYDVAICMYHDQALIPIKTLEFDSAVNITLGLPFIRTSPDHGTAFDIAGKNLANPASLIKAMQIAAQMANIQCQ